MGYPKTYFDQIFFLCFLGCIFLSGCGKQAIKPGTEKNTSEILSLTRKMDSSSMPAGISSEGGKEAIKQRKEELESILAQKKQKEEELKCRIMQDIPISGSTSSGGTDCRVVYEDGWVYASDKNLFRMKPDGTQREDLADMAGKSICVTSEGVFFIKNPGDRGSDDHIYHMDYDGSNLKPLNRQFSLNLQVADGWLYYTAPPDFGVGTGPDNVIYRMKTDGTCKEQLSCDVGVLHLSVADGWLYYLYLSGGSKDKDQESLWRMRIDGSDMQKIYSNINGYHYEDGWIYLYLGHDGKQQGRVRPDGSQFEELHWEGYLIHGWDIYIQMILI